MKEKNILFAISDIDEKYIEDARPRGRRRRAIVKYLTVAASLAIVIGLSVGMLAVFGGTPGGSYDDGPSGSDEGESSGGEPSGPQGPSAEIPGDRYSEYYAGQNYSRLMAILGSFDRDGDGYYLQEDVESGDFGTGTVKPESGSASGNGSFIGVTENQVEGVEEPDIFKMTDKYIFRIGGAKDGGEALRIYTLDGDASTQVGEYPIPHFKGGKYSVGADMFLSDDGSTATLIKTYCVENEGYTYKTTLMLIDVSDVSSPSLVKHITVNGICDFARSTEGKILLGTTFLSVLHGYDWSNSEEYLPYWECEGERVYSDPDDIICPDEIYKREYSSFYILDEKLNVLSDKTLFGYGGSSYVSESKIVTYVGYGMEHFRLGDETEIKTDFAVLDYSSGSLNVESLLTAEGWVDDRFFIDESDGYLRVVTNDYYYHGFSVSARNTSLYIFKLDNCSLRAKIEDFAPEGEAAMSVRFEGDNLYVCTALIRFNYFSDPVYFFDLSDYDNITQVNTGVIEGFSSALITYNDGYLIGIGSLDTETNKVSVYKREGEGVVTVAEYFFRGVHSTDRKAFIIDKERGLFGFASGAYFDENNNLIIGLYHLLKLDGDSLTEIYTVEELNHNVSSLRSVYYDGYLYITKNMDILVERVE